MKGSSWILLGVTSALVAGLSHCSPERRSSSGDVNALVANLVAEAQERALGLRSRPHSLASPIPDGYPATLPGDPWPEPTADPTATPARSEPPDVPLPGSLSEGAPAVPGGVVPYAPPVANPAPYAAPAAKAPDFVAPVPGHDPFRSATVGGNCDVRSACERFLSRLSFMSGKEPAFAGGCSSLPSAQSCPAARYLDCAGESLSGFIARIAEPGPGPFSAFCASFNACLAELAASSSFAARPMVCEGPSVP